MLDFKKRQKYHPGAFMPLLNNRFIEVVEPKDFVNNPTYKAMANKDNGAFTAYGLAHLEYALKGFEKNFDSKEMAKFMTELKLDAVVIGNYFYWPDQESLETHLNVLINDNGSAERAWIFSLGAGKRIGRGSGASSTHVAGVQWEGSEDKIKALENLSSACTQIMATIMAEKLSSKDSGAIGWQQGE